MVDFEYLILLPMPSESLTASKRSSLLLISINQHNGISNKVLVAFVYLTYLENLISQEKGDTKFADVWRAQQRIVVFQFKEINIVVYGSNNVGLSCCRSDGLSRSPIVTNHLYAVPIIDHVLTCKLCLGLCLLWQATEQVCGSPTDLINIQVVYKLEFTNGSFIRLVIIICIY